MTLFENIKTLERVVVIDTARNTTTENLGQVMVIYRPAGVDSHLMVQDHAQFQTLFREMQGTVDDH